MARTKPSCARLRRFRNEDAADVCRIYPMFFVDNAIDIKGGRLTVADVGGRVVGIVLWSPALEPAWFDPGISRWAELNELHVHPEFQNRGIGRRLVLAAIRQAKRDGYPAMYLETEESNGPARKAYEKAGFREHNRVIRYKVRL